jgi:glutamyl-tRNA synthetase
MRSVPRRLPARADGPSGSGSGRRRRSFLTRSSVRVRFAPSPTGAPHIGGFRTALFDWLFARRHGGAFIIRIEDTDQERYVPESVPQILHGLRWLGLEYDEGPDIGGPHGPYTQTERLPLYRDELRRMVEAGRAYPCFCTRERLDQLRAEQTARGEPTGYDRRCRDLSPAERERLRAAGTPHVFRFAMPLSGETTFQDEVKGEISFQHALLDDFVLMKSSGIPASTLAIPVDDHAMAITHVLRGDEWVSTTPKHILIHQALGHEPPKYAHLPVITGPDGKKLSKRHGETAIGAFEQKGYLPEALTNFLALLGWSPGNDQELFTRSELVTAFDLGAVSRSPAVFNEEKLIWMNGVYLRQLPPAELAERALPFLQSAGLVPDQPSEALRDYVQRAVALEQERVRTLAEVPEATEFFFRDVPVYDERAVRRWLSREDTPPLLHAAAAALADVEPWTEAGLETAIRSVADAKGVNAGEVIHRVRAAVTGRTAGPGLFETLAVLGRERVLQRLEAAAARCWEPA